MDDFKNARITNNLNILKLVKNEKLQSCYKSLLKFCEIRAIDFFRNKNVYQKMLIYFQILLYKKGISMYNFAHKS